MSIRLVVLAVICSLSLNAYSQEPFICNSDFHVVYGDEGQLFSYDVVSDTLVFAPNNAGERINAFGYRVADNFAYGVTVGVSAVGLLRLGSDGSIEKLGPIAGIPNDVVFPAGDFGPDGLLYLYPLGQVSPLNIMYVVDVDTVSVVETIALAGPTFTVADMAFNPVDNLFYAVTNDVLMLAEQDPLLLIAIDINLGSYNIIGPTNLPNSVAITSAFLDGSGVFYGTEKDNEGILYVFDGLTGNATAIGQTINSTSQDGFFCSANPGPNVRPQIVPTLSEWGFIAMASILGIVGFMVMRRRKVTA